MSSANSLVKFEFHGDELWATWRNGNLWIPVKRICECLGIDEEAQRQRLSRAKWARTCMVQVPDSRGHEQPMFCIHIDSLPMLQRRRNVRSSSIWRRVSRSSSSIW